MKNVHDSAKKRIESSGMSLETCRLNIIIQLANAFSSAGIEHAVNIERSSGDSNDDDGGAASALEPLLGFFVGLVTAIYTYLSPL